eukprot:3139926-Lingulodinium_polyedra.AAC.1
MSTKEPGCRRRRSTCSGLERFARAMRSSTIVLRSVSFAASRRRMARSAGSGDASNAPFTESSVSTSGE